MGDDLYPATCEVSYPTTTTADATWRFLHGMFLVRWRWEAFLWKLRELRRLLTKTPAEFNYLFVTAFLKARAAYLAATGPFDGCTQQAVLTALGTYKVQFGSIYLRLFQRLLEETLSSEMGRQMIGAREERLFQVAVGGMERRYREVLEVIALSEDHQEEIHGETVESWITGTVVRNGRRVSAIPAPVPVQVQLQKWGPYRLVRACARDMVRKIKSGDPIRSFLERAGKASGADVEIEKASRFPKLTGYPLLRYGQMDVQYYRTLTNETKRTLYVVCADRTMRMHQKEGEAPGSRPKTIELLHGKRGPADLYWVTFDSGKAGAYAIDFRPHKENERLCVPEAVWQTADGVAAPEREREEAAEGAAAETESDSEATADGECLAAGTEVEPVAGEGLAGAEAVRAKAEAGGGRPTGGRAAAAVVAAANTRGQANCVGWQIEGECRMIRLPGGKVVDLRTKHKARGVLGFILRQVAATGSRAFTDGHIREDYNAQFPDSLAHRRWNCDRIREDLFRGKEREFDLMFEAVDKKMGRYRVRGTGAGEQ